MGRRCSPALSTGSIRWTTPDGGYFRVIDYKTGHKEFDYTDLLCGQGLQMLLYLFAIERSKGTATRQPDESLRAYSTCRGVWTW